MIYQFKGISRQYCNNRQTVLVSTRADICLLVRVWQVPSKASNKGVLFADRLTIAATKQGLLGDFAQ